MKPNYALKTTVGQTLKSNASLETAEKNKRFLYDFSLLYESSLPDGKTQEIKMQIVKYVDIAFRESSLFSQSDSQFDYYSGECYVKAYPCYTKDGRQKYVIMRLVKLDIVFKERKSV